MKIGPLSCGRSTIIIQPTWNLNSPPVCLSPPTITDCQEGVLAKEGIPEVDLPPLWSPTMPMASAP